jgi:flagellar hook-associated protein 3 FlgL
MRITENIVSYNYLENVNQTREKIVDLQAQMASGKRVRKPSDDPRASDAIIRLTQALASNEQYSRNVEDGRGMADVTSTTLDGAAELFLTFKEVVVKASNGSADESFNIYAQQVDQLLSQMLSIANTRFNGKHIFGGTQTLEVPFTLSLDRQTVTKNPNGVGGTISYPVSDVLSQKVNISGEEAFQGTAIFDLMIQVRNTLLGKTPPTKTEVDAVNAGFDHLLQTTSTAGSYVQGLDALTEHLDQQKTKLMEFLSAEQDSDLAESVMKLKQQETMLEAAINTGARILPKTLLDFLR